MKADIGYRLLGIFGLYSGLNAHSTGNQYGQSSYSIATLGIASSCHLDRYKGRVNTIDEKVSMGRLHLGMGYRF